MYIEETGCIFGSVVVREVHVWSHERQADTLETRTILRIACEDRLAALARPNSSASLSRKGILVLPLC